MFLKKIDIYGYKLGFSLNSETNLKSTFGGLFTILTVILYILIFNYLARDFYLKINPKFTLEKVALSESVRNNFTITYDTFFLAIDTPNYFKDPNLYKFSLNFVEEYENYNKSMNLDFITCDQVNYSYIFNYYYGPNTFTCFNLTKIFNNDLTNEYYSEYLSFNYLDFYVDYNYNYLSSLNETYRNKLLNSDEIMYFYTPQISFSPNNYKNPLYLQLNFDSLNINKDTKYNNFFNFIVSKLEQNENFFYDTFSEIHSEIHYTNKDLRIFPRVYESDYLAKFRIKLDGFYFNKYKINYKNIPDILAQIFGIMQPLSLALSYIIQYLTKYFLDQYLVNNFLCYFTKDNSNDDNLIWGYQNFKDFKNVFKNVNKSHENQESNLIREFSKINIQENFLEKLSLSDIHPKIIYKKNTANQTMKKIVPSINSSILFQDKILPCMNDSGLNDNSDMILDKSSEVVKYFNSNTFFKNYNRKKNEQKKKMIDSFKSYSKIDNKFPFIGFKEYYFAFLIPKNKNNSNSILILRNILKYFSKRILQKLDFFYYLKLVRIVEILKNTFLRNRVEKESLQFLLKSLYFLRDCDIESIAHEIDKNSN